ncbi:methylmalonyl-CoA mutase subunit beta [Streptomyces hoynatensis]|uniref:methylmalonyl-CoA mutase n=1 Tax=Streptomyces hoynatensis TaxID=1141874 RepID=A0A3A9YKA4_9ACTN|nr:methylmalonyl-CoA mutase subunit beta [Streptomyces hoynatensis]RKN37085.1 methylmalonyl-CoA mutase [Streptomyces hoynatensis]
MTVSTDPAAGELPLAAEFPAADREQWRRLVAGVLRKGGAELSGEAAEEALATRLQDGIVTRPLYTAQDAPAADRGYPGFAPFVRGGRPEGTAPAGWDVRQRHTGTDAREVNAAALTDLENGATSLWLATGEGGVPVAALGTALDGVLLDLAPVVLDPGASFESAARELLRLAEERGVPAAAVRGNLGADPLGLLARTGEDAELTPRLWAAAGLAARCHRDHPALRALVVDALPYHSAGGSTAQELGCALATGLAYLRELTRAGLPLDAAFGQLEFRYAATADQFLTIAKLRAARRLWSRVAEACGAAAGAGAQLQHAVTSPVMMTRRDPWVNMLRTTVACLAAGTGGADAVTVLPYDQAIGGPHAFSRRIARNTSTVLIEESHLARVVDPAGGSWYVERLTDEVARAAWAWFQEIERAGGQAAALRSGLVAERLAATWRERAEELATRREPITGVSEFADPNEPPPPAAPPRAAGGGLPEVRRDEAFEALRTRSDAHAAATGEPPRVFLAALGPAAAHTARAAFAANLFQAAGIRAVHEPASVDADTVAAAFAAADTTVACLCSDEAGYAAQGAAVAAALKAAGAGRVLLAGRPGKQGEALAAAGVDEFVFQGGDAVALLTSVLDSLGVA